MLNGGAAYLIDDFGHVYTPSRAGRDGTAPIDDPVAARLLEELKKGS